MDASGDIINPRQHSLNGNNISKLVGECGSAASITKPLTKWLCAELDCSNI
jgi:hypothetical protein